MQTKACVILILVCIFVTGCRAPVNVPQPTASETPTLIPSPTETSTPIQTPAQLVMEIVPNTPSGPTMTATTTPLPQISMPIIMENGQPKFNFEGGFSVLPYMEELQIQFGEEPWSQELIAKWHEYLSTVRFKGQPLAKPLANVAYVCIFTWEKGIHRDVDIGSVSDLRINYMTIPCTKEMYPIRPIAAFRDGLTSLYAVTFLWWDPETQKDLFRTFVFPQMYEDPLNMSSYLGITPYPNFEITCGKKIAASNCTVMNILTSLTGSAYDVETIDAALNTNGIYDPLFDRQVIIGATSYKTFTPSDDPWAMTALAKTQTPFPTSTTTP